MDDLEKIISQLISLQQKLIKSTDNKKVNQFTLSKLVDIAEMFVHSTPNMEVRTYKDEVIVSGEIPNILNPQDISVALDGGLLLSIECRWYKSDETENPELKPHEFKKKIELPYPVNPVTLSVIYQNGILKISAKRAIKTNIWTAKAQFLD